MEQLTSEPSASNHVMLGSPSELEGNGILDSARVHGQRMWANIGTTLRPVIQDIQENDHKIATASIGAGLIASQVLDRSRVAIVLVPEVGTTVLEHTQNPILTGLAAAGTNFAWTSMVGEFTTQGMTNYPNSVKSFSEKFPKFVDFFQSGLPGLKKKGTPNIGPADKKSADYIKSETLMHAKRAATGMGLGSTAFVATASTMDYTKREMRRVNLGVSLDTSAIVFGAGWGLGKYVMNAADNGDYEKVQTIQGWVGNSRNWLALAGALILTDYTSKKVHARKERKTEEAEAAAIAEANRIKLPEKYAKYITTPRAWLAVGALALASTEEKSPGKMTNGRLSVLTNVATRIVVDRLNKKGKFDIPK